MRTKKEGGASGCGRATEACVQGAHRRSLSPAGGPRLTDGDAVGVHAGGRACEPDRAIRREAPHELRGWQRCGGLDSPKSPRLSDSLSAKYCVVMIRTISAWSTAGSSSCPLHSGVLHNCRRFELAAGSCQGGSAGAAAAAGLHSCPPAARQLPSAGLCDAGDAGSGSSNMCSSSSSSTNHGGSRCGASALQQSILEFFAARHCCRRSVHVATDMATAASNARRRHRRGRPPRPQAAALSM